MLSLPVDFCVLFVSLASISFIDMDIIFKFRFIFSISSLISFSCSSCSFFFLSSSFLTRSLLFHFKSQNQTHLRQKSKRILFRVSGYFLSEISEYLTWTGSQWL